MGGMNCKEKRPTSEKEELLCMALPLKHPSSNPNMQSSNLPFDETVHTSYACGNQAPAGGGDMQLHPCFVIRDISIVPLDSPLRQLIHSPYAVLFLQPDNDQIYYQLRQLMRDYPNPNLVLLPSLNGHGHEVAPTNLLRE